MNPEAKRIISVLGLEPLPLEGGFFRGTWRGPLAAGRASGSSILFLVTDGGFSALHRLSQDEVWHFHAGDPVEHLQLGPEPGTIRVTTLGSNILGGHAPQLVARAGSWQGARLLSSPSTGRGWALMGCTMAPGWTDELFELGDRASLLAAFPAAAERIEALTRSVGF